MSTCLIRFSQEGDKWVHAAGCLDVVRDPSLCLAPLQVRYLPSLIVSSEHIDILDYFNQVNGTYPTETIKWSIQTANIQFLQRISKQNQFCVYPPAILHAYLCANVFTLEQTKFLLSLEFKELPADELRNAVVFSCPPGSYHEPILPILELIFSDPRAKFTSEITSSFCEIFSREEIFDLAFSKFEKTDEKMNNLLQTACDKSATGLITKLCEIHKYQAKVLTKQMDRAIESKQLQVYVQSSHHPATSTILPTSRFVASFALLKAQTGGIHPFSSSMCPF